MQSKILVFTSPTCPHCPSALRLAREIEKSRDDVKVEEYSTATKDGARKAEYYNVMSVPTVFVRGPAHNQNIGFRGTPPKDRLLKAIDISLGKASFDDMVEKGFFAKLQEKLGVKIKT